MRGVRVAVFVYGSPDQQLVGASVWCAGMSRRRENSGQSMVTVICQGEAMHFVIPEPAKAFFKSNLIPLKNTNGSSTPTVNLLLHARGWGLRGMSHVCFPGSEKLFVSYVWL